MEFDADAETRLEQERVAYWIRRLADEKGLSLNRVSMEAKVSSPSLYDLLKFRVTPTLRTLTSIARGLSVEVYDLLRPIPDGSALEPITDDKAETTSD